MYDEDKEEEYRSLQIHWIQKIKKLDEENNELLDNYVQDYEKKIMQYQNTLQMNVKLKENTNKEIKALQKRIVNLGKNRRYREAENYAKKLDKMK